MEGPEQVSMLDYLAALLIEYTPGGAALIALCGGDIRLVLTHVASNVVIALAYLAIPAALLFILYRLNIRNVVFRGALWRTVAFVGGCGLCHAFHVWLYWRPDLYGWSAVTHLFTALASAEAVRYAVFPMTHALRKMPNLDELLEVIAERDMALADSATMRADLTRDRDFLLKELHHRLRNTLAVVMGTLRSQQRVLTEPVAREALESAINRIHAIVAVHEKLYHPDVVSGRVNAHDFIGGICFELSRQTDATITHDIDTSISLRVDQSVPLAMVVNELVTNAMKHGRRNGEPARVHVDLQPVDGSWALVVQDEGHGMPSEVWARPQKTSLGLRMLRALAAQLGGEITVEATPKGTRTRLMSKGR